MKRKILITGGGGYIGTKLAQRFLARTDDEVVLWLRASDADAFAERRRVCDAVLGDAARRVQYAHGDLADDSPFHAIDPRGIKAIFHPAANTHFNIDAATADAVNIRGTDKLLAFAERCPELESVAVISTIYSSGLHGGSIGEAAFDDAAGFANHYERSKWASERSVDRHAALPWRVFRIATVLADDDSGHVLQYNIAHKVKRLMFVGLLPIFPGLAAMPIYFVTGDFVADAMFALAERAPLRTIFNLCPTADESLTLGRWLELSYDYFSREPEFARRRFMRPIFTDLKAFQALAKSVDAFSRDVTMQAVVKLVSPFAEQMFVTKQLDNRAGRALLPEWRAPDAAGLLERTCAHLARTEWGAQPSGQRPVRLWDA